MSLLPAPLHLQLPASHAASPRMRAHLMPLRIEYDGPAPITRYFLVRPEAPASGANGSAAQPAAAEEGEASSPATAPSTYEAAFRGRALHGTALELAPLQLYLCDVPSSSSSSSSAAAAAPAVSAPAKRIKVVAPPAPESSDAGLRRSPRKRAMPPPPPPAKKKGAKMQVFSMDSDSEGEPADEEEQGLGWDDDKAPDGPRSTSPEAPAEDQPAASPEQRAQARAMHVRAAADELILWAPDGPVDKGDDVYWRTLREWQGVRAGLMQCK